MLVNYQKMCVTFATGTRQSKATIAVIGTMTNKPSSTHHQNEV